VFIADSLCCLDFGILLHASVRLWLVCDADVYLPDPKCLTGGWAGWARGCGHCCVQSVWLLLSPERLPGAAGGSSGRCVCVCGWGGGARRWAKALGLHGWVKGRMTQLWPGKLCKGGPLDREGRGFS
jgi:hypothetical protein